MVPSPYGSPPLYLQEHILEGFGRSEGIAKVRFSYQADAGTECELVQQVKWKITDTNLAEKPIQQRSTQHETKLWNSSSDHYRP